MHNAIKNIYILIKDNKAVVCESNLKDCFKQFPEVLTENKGYDYYYNKMRLINYFIIPFAKEYRLQKIEY
ncbi:hypothetical protein J2810_004564 [Chryseobacterium rhizosphaerae]|uniref:hypothetical protein n=1 Tax=Chryseobacterium rhizosphaerae TaxID=395937 RepID=UPI00285ED529|nr:hypothetical protein [Chryseobacterium rhizosphaerae]MDR6548474.1 hypothetical protein [Chryseobacterium rhizosphaerae]